jgi:hypothetical protein
MATIIVARMATIIVARMATIIVVIAITNPKWT